MNRLLAFLLTGFLFLTACQSRPVVAQPGVSQEPAPAPPPSQSPPTPSPRETQTLASLLSVICRMQEDKPSQLEALRQYVETVLQGVDPAGVEARVRQESGTCLHATKGQQTDIFLIAGGSSAGWPTAVAW